MQTQRDFEEMTKKDDFHDNQVREIQAIMLHDLIIILPGFSRIYRRSSNNAIFFQLSMNSYILFYWFVLCFLILLFV